MKKIIAFGLVSASLALLPLEGFAQYKKKKDGKETPKTEVQLILEEADSAETPVVISLEQALKIALSENIAVKVADKEIERTKYAKKGTYASLFPQIDATGSYQRTIKKQVMYMDFDMSSFGGGSAAGSGSTGSGTAGTGEGSGTGSGSTASSSKNNGGLEVGRWNTWSAGVSASMPVVNAQLWKSIKISGMDVELAVEKARASRLDMVSQVKNAYYAVLFSKEAFNVYKEVYENAMTNYAETEKKYNVQKATDLDMARAKTNVANAIPNVYNAESSIILALWQLKAVMGIDLEMNIDVEGAIEDYSEYMTSDVTKADSISLDRNSTMKQLEIQANELAQSIKAQQYAYIPTLSLAFNYSYNAMTNDFNFKEYRWTPYSYVGVSLSIPIFSGGKRLNQVRQARNSYEQMRLQMTSTERNLKISIRQSLNTMETNVKSYDAAKDAVASAEKAYSIAEKSYEVGRATLTDLNDAQLALTQARLAESQAVYNFIVAKTQLEQTLGQDFTE
ncbi:MAG: TolC family protein [Candidatus Cryptobacteroides sp.]|nr:TolC family protein [Bacteroidales bacterium]MDD7133512.1 TolC family protein [Bacteroidales bacterium]MDY2773671.1 TolC family protein [Candidatus Cryptobacteroides sp.]